MASFLLNVPIFSLLATRRPLCPPQRKNPAPSAKTAGLVALSLLLVGALSAACEGPRGTPAPVVRPPADEREDAFHRWCRDRFGFPLTRSNEGWRYSPLEWRCAGVPLKDRE
jgi:hypothetical protein